MSKDKRNRIYCHLAGSYKNLYETKDEADRFIIENADAIKQRSGYAPVRSYYCPMCLGYHVTSQQDKLPYEDIGRRVIVEEIKPAETAVEKIITKKEKIEIQRYYDDEKLNRYKNWYEVFTTRLHDAIDRDESSDITKWLREVINYARHFKDQSMSLGNEKFIEEAQNQCDTVIDECTDTLFSLFGKVDYLYENMMKEEASTLFNSIIDITKSLSKIEEDDSVTEIFSSLIDSNIERFATDNMYTPPTEGKVKMKHAARYLLTLVEDAERCVEMKDWCNAQSGIDKSVNFVNRLSDKKRETSREDICKLIDRLIEVQNKIKQVFCGIELPDNEPIEDIFDYAERVY